MPARPTYTFDVEGHTVVEGEKEKPERVECPQEILIGMAIVLVIGCCLIIAFAVHIQIPDQQYCDTVLEQRHHSALGPVWYLESLHPYDYSLNQSRCIYDRNGTFIANPEFSIWGIRV